MLRNCVEIMGVFTFLISFFRFFFLMWAILFFLAALGFCCTQAFPSCGERGLLFVAVCGLLTAVASLVVEDRL